MTFSVSPGVYTREQDFTASAQAELSSNGSFAGKFTWGPVLKRTRISGEPEMVNRFGRPNDDSAVDFLTAASFLSFSSAIDIVRIGNSTDMKNAVTSGTAVTILNDDTYDIDASTIAAIEFIAKYPGTLGNSLAIATCTSAAEYQVALPGTFTFETAPRSKVVSYTPAATETLADYFNVGDFLVVDGVKYFVAAVTAGSPQSLTLNKIYTGKAVPTTVVRRWAFADVFGAAPETNRAHVVILDKGGKFTGVEGSVLETYASVSLTAGVKFDDGTSAFFEDVLNRSAFVRVGGAGISGINSADKVDILSFTGGVDGSELFGDDEYIAGFSLFSNPLEVDAPLIIGGAASVTSASKVVGSFVLENICEVRKDGVAFFSPALESVVNNAGDEEVDIVADRQDMPYTSYGHFDGNWKYMYDRYNDKFRWVPCCGDSAGIYARTDRESETWFSGAGVNRGRLKNVVRLAWNPDEARRDVLYSNDVNPIIDLPSYGPVLYGDKTMKGGNSAFNRMNVRRLFIVLEKTIATFAEQTLFEVNDEFTQRRFVAGIDPFMRDVKGKRGVEDYLIIADERVNTPAVKQANQFVGQILVRPLYSINFLRLDFAAVGASVEFTEVIGQ